MMDAIPSILSGGIAGAVLVWLLRGWISERLQQSIRHEYSQKLETHKAELNTRIQAMQHENQLQQLRTSLFFNHQRDAFASLLANIAEVNQKWMDEGYHDRLTDPVPYKAYQDFRATFFKHQLFFDSACLAAIDLVLDSYKDSFADDEYGPPDPEDVGSAYEAVQFLQPRLAELFQNRIGVSKSHRAELEIALFGSIKILNRYSFSEISLSPTDLLKLDRNAQPAEAVLKAESNYDELMVKLRRFDAYMKEHGSFFHDASMNATRYLEILSQLKE